MYVIVLLQFSEQRDGGKFKTGRSVGIKRYTKRTANSGRSLEANTNGEGENDNRNEIEIEIEDACACAPTGKPVGTAHGE